MLAHGIIISVNQTNNAKQTSPPRAGFFVPAIYTRDLSAALKLVVEVSSRLKTVVSSG
jgi:hypothetical protein